MPLTSEDVELEGGPVESTVDRELVETLLALRAVTLSGSIFQDIAFQSLKDFGTPIMPEPIGRENPFTPYYQSATSNFQPAEEDEDFLMNY